MESLPHESAELHKLVGRLCDEGLAAADFARLTELLSIDVEAQRFYVHYTDIVDSLRQMAVALDQQESVADLQAKLVELNVLNEQMLLAGAAAASENKSADKVEPVAKKAAWSAGTSSRLSVRQWWNSMGTSTLAFLLGAFLASVVVIQFVRTGSLGPLQAHASIESRPVGTAVAYLTSTTGCNWEDATLGLRATGSGVQIGEEIALTEGVAEFRLATGVYLSIEGPAGLVLTSPDSMVLQYGKVTTRIPWLNKEYRVMAGGCRLTASDSEFGVSVAGGRIDTHVFVGEVLATNALVMGHNAAQADDAPESSPSADDAFERTTISEGQSLALATRDGTIKVARLNRADPSIFATKLNMAGPLPISKAYVDAVLASGPKAYWRFESGKNGVVTSEVPGGGEMLIAGDIRLTELAGNRVAELPPGGDCYLCSRATMDDLANSDYSFEVWVKPSHIHYGTILGLCPSEPDTTLQNAFLLEVQSSTHLSRRANFGRPNTIRFLHRDPVTQGRGGTNCFSTDPYSVRRWQHVVAVKRGAQMELYVDGKLQGQSTESALLPVGQIFMIGRQGPVDSAIQFIGQLDEVAVYARPLTPEEIQAHFKLIDWKKSEKSLVESNSS